jgi:hypothetical protein
MRNSAPREKKKTVIVVGILTTWASHLRKCLDSARERRAF